MSNTNNKIGDTPRKVHGMSALSTVSSELKEPVLAFSSALNVQGLSSPTIQFTLFSSPEIRYVVRKPVGTPRVVAIERDIMIDGWRLKSTLLVQINSTRKEAVATTWLEGVAEYGVAKNENEAMRDLIVSLGEYRESLEKRKKSLGDSAKKELECLRKLIERVPESLS